MAISESGRIVIQIPPTLKRKLYKDLAKHGMSLTDWFLDQAEIYLNTPLPTTQDAATMSSPLDLKNDILGDVAEPLPEMQSEGIGATHTVQSESAAKTVKQRLISTYNALEEKFPVRVISDNVSYASPVNFVESLKCARHRWFPYKEGFSPTFVRSFLNEFQTSKSDVVLDPFSGVGTTSLVASTIGHRTVGFDVSPMADFIARTKCITLTEQELLALDEYIRFVTNATGHAAHGVPNNDTVISYFAPEFLEALMQVKALANLADNQKIRALARLAFLTLVETFSTHRKAGNGVKRKTKFAYGLANNTPFAEVRNCFVKKLQDMRQDLDEVQIGIAPDFRLGSCLDESAFSNIDSIGAVLTSPPYANCFDYSKIYQRELWLGDFFESTADLKHFRQGSVRSHVHASWAERHTEFSSDIVENLICEHLKNQELWSKKIPNMLSGYFKDVGALLSNIQPRMKSGASFGLVVGNSVYGGIPVATDLLIGQLALDAGFKLERIDVYRSVIPSSQQFNIMEDKRWARESMVVIQKK
jgi:hypothetical protein